MEEANPILCRLRLLPNAEQRAAILDIVSAYVDLLAWLEAEIPAGTALNMVELHNAWYEKARAHSSLPARLVTLALKDFAHNRRKPPIAGLPLDDRLFSIKTINILSLATRDQRVLVPFQVLGYEPAVFIEQSGVTARLTIDDGNIDLVAASPTPDSTIKEAFMTATDTVVTRIGRVIAGMTHAAITAAEQTNPVAVIEQSIREIDSAADEVKAELGKAMAERTRVEMRKAELGREHAELGGKLQAAMNSGREDLASAGLGRQIDIESQVAVLDRLLGEAGEKIKGLEEALSAVRASRREAEERLAEFKKSEGTNGNGQDGGTHHDATGKALGKVERAQAAAARIAGVPASQERTDAASLDELSKIARDRAISERLKKLKGQN
jgi:phage shock protein A